MKILNICSRIDKKSGGGSVAVIELARIFQSTGLDVDNWVVTDKNDGELLDVDGLQVEFFKSSLASNKFRFSVGISKKIIFNINQYDAVVLSGLFLFPNSLAAYFCKKNSIPYIFFPYDCFNTERLGYYDLKKRVYRFLFDNNLVRGSKLIQAANKEEYDQVKNFTKKENNIFIASYGFPVDKYAHKKDKAIFENLIPWKFGEYKTLLYLARISKTKGIEVLIRAFENINKMDPNYKLLIVGSKWDEKYYDYLVHKYKDLILEGKIHFTGQVSDDEKYACYQYSYLYILPSYSENFGITVLESLANGTIPITTTAVPWEELVINNAGYRVTPGDHEALSECILLHSRLPEEVKKQMQLNGISLSLNYDYESVGKIYNKIITGIEKIG
jgi:glycosyltransferase involved in cell wall biosynthesis